MIVRRSFAPAAVAVALLLACGGPGSEDVLGFASPPGVVAQAALDVLWSIQEASGCGSITSAGVYTAPATAPSTPCHIVAHVASDTAVSNVASVSIAAASPAPPPPAPPPPAPPPPATGGDAISRCASDPLRTTGTVYYVCSCDAGADPGCTAGNDANPGTSPSAPKRTFAAAQTLFRGMNAGDTVALCKGGSWAGVTSAAPHWANARCRADSTCDLRAYDPPGTSGRARPYLDVAGSRFADFGASSAAGSAGYRFQGLSLHGRTGGENWAFFFSQDVNDVLICDNKIDAFDIGIHLRHQYGVADRVHFVSNTVTNNAGQGYLGASNGGRVESNVFDDNGATDRDHNVYLAANALSMGGSGMIVRGNHSTRSAGRGGACASTHIVVHGQFDGLLIEGNVIEESGGFATPGCWGIGIVRDSEPPDSTINPEYFRNVTIRGNTLRNLGNVMVTVDQCENCVVENNLAIPKPDGDSSAIRVGATAPQSGANGADADVLNVKVRNNTVYAAMSGGAGATVKGVDMPRAGGGGHEVYNNAVYISGAGGSCIVPNGTVFNANNACTTTANASWFQAAGSSFVPGPSSPLANAGTTRNGQAPTIDITGKTRDATPDIGAYER